MTNLSTVIQGFRISPIQQQLWAQNQSQPVSCVQCAILLYGELEISLLRQSIQRVVDHHEILRTHFHQSTGSKYPFQVIEVDATFSWTYLDWRTLDAIALDLKIDELFVSHPYRWDELATSPLLQVYLCAISNEQHLLLLQLPSLCADAWTMKILQFEIEGFYHSFLQDKPLQLEESVQYVQFSEWHHELLADQESTTGHTYWQTQNRAAITNVVTPFERDILLQRPFSPASFQLKLAKNSLHCIINFAQDHEVDSSVVLAACWCSFLARISNTSCFELGMTFDGRQYEELKGVCGPLARVIPLPFSYEPGSHLSTIVKVLNSLLEEMSIWQEYYEPYTDRIETPENALYSFSFEHWEETSNSTVHACPTFTRDRCYCYIVPFKVYLSCIQRENELSLEFQYDRELFSREDIHRLAGLFRSFLNNVLDEPALPVDLVPLLDCVEQQTLLFDVNTTARDYPKDRCLHQLFEEQAARTPNAAAVIAQEKSWTYVELNTRANKLAHKLRQLGIQPEHLVGLFVEHSIEMVVAILGILKAGAAYVPLDPTYPTERLTFTLTDASVSILLTQDKLKQQLPPLDLCVLCLENDLDDDEGTALENQAVSVVSTNLAYVIYTSGSTGKPKGVQITHKGLVNYLTWCIDIYCITHGSNSLVHSPLGFDLTVTSLFAPLLVGGSIILRSTEHSLESLANTLRQRGKLSLLKVTPSHLRALQRLCHPQEIQAKVDTLVIGGEALRSDDVSLWCAHCPQTQIINEYGPTETVVGSVAYEVGNDPALTTNIPIGRPIANTQIYVLDKHLMPTPKGLPGELYIAGDGVARGYLNRPQMTAERFLPNPFSMTPGTRLYRTGDLVRYLPDNQLEYLGRVDRQVKLRGFRIELGEIESVLFQHHEVRECAVVIREDIPLQQKIIAYIVPAFLYKPDTDTLRTYLAEYLPDYMLPQSLLYLQSLPLTPNGKLNYDALPSPSESEAQFDQPFVEPRTETEKVLADIWSQLLAVEKIGIHDNFFKLGGDSILSIQMAARANEKAIYLLPKQIFQYQTIAELASLDTPSIPQTEQETITGQVPLTPIQHWFFENELVNRNQWNQSVFLDVYQPVNPTILEQAIQYLLLHHDALRSRFHAHGDQYQQIITVQPERIPVTCLDLSTLSQAEQEEETSAVAVACQSTLDIANGPLLRIVLFDYGQARINRLLAVIHHLIIDAVSWRILLEDLCIVYEQIEQKKQPQLASKTTSYQEWASRLIEYAQEEATQAELAFWRDQFQSPIKPFPRDYTNHLNNLEDNIEAMRREVSTSLNIDETRRLRQEANAAYNTQVMDLILAAFLHTYNDWTGESALLIDLEGHGREDIFSNLNLSRTIGWFTTIFPIVFTYEDTSPPALLIKQVKEQIRAIPQRGIGYGILRYLSQDPSIRQSLSSLPQADISFNYLGQLDHGTSPSSPFRLCSDTAGLERNPENKRSYLIEIEAAVVEGYLQIKWIYSEHVHQRSTIETLSSDLLSTLRQLIEHCLSPQVGGYTPSDFPLATLEQSILDSVVGKRRNIEDIYPLTPLQQGLLFHMLYQPRKGDYIEQLQCHIQGNLDVFVFWQSWQRMIDQYPVLRTRFLWKELDEPIQVVERHVPLRYEQLDLRSLTPTEQKQHLNHFLERERMSGFELSNAPLMQMTLIQLDDENFQFIWSHHHILLDGWSLYLVLAAYLATYEALSQGAPLSLRQPRPYRDYLAWLKEQPLEEAKHFWQQQLRDITESNSPLPWLELRHHSVEEDIVGSAVDTREEYMIQLSVPLTQTLITFAQENQLTLNSIAMGAWALLLSHYKGSNDVLFGTTVAGRPATLAGVESMVGLFINTLPMRVQLAPHSSLLSWLHNLQMQHATLRQYDYISLAQIQKWSALSQGKPLFESLFVFENFPADKTLHKQISSITISEIKWVERSNYPLHIMAMVDTQLTFQLIYDKRYISRPMVDTMMAQYTAAIEKIITTPTITLSQFSIAPDSKLKESVEYFNASIGNE